MSDFDIKNKVVQANDLIQFSKWNLNAVPLKILKTLVSCIDTNKPPKDNTVYITKQELFKIIGSESDGSYDYLKRKIRELQKNSIKIDEPNREIFVPLVNKIVWDKNDDHIMCRFDEDLMPYLIDLQERFLQYDVAALKNFDSKYGLIMYEYLLSRERQERQSEHKYSISIENLRHLTDTEKKFKEFKDLKKRVIEQATEDINSSGVEFLVKTANNGKRGVKATHVEFTLRKRTSYKETNFDVVEYPEWINKPI